MRRKKNQKGNRMRKIIVHTFSAASGPFAIHSGPVKSGERS